MLRLSFQEVAALELVLSFSSVKELLNAAMNGFVDSEVPTQQDNEMSDLCWKAIKIIP